MNVWKPLARLFVLSFTLFVVQAPAILGQDLPAELGSSIKSLKDAKAYCERVLREVEAGTSVLVPFQVKTVDGKTMLIDQYRALPKETRPKLLETERVPVDIKDIQLRLSAAKLSAEDQKRVIADMIADSRANTEALKKRLAKIEESLGLNTIQTGANSGKQITLQGEVVEVTGDKVRIAMKSMVPQVGDPVKISYEIAGTGIKADVAKGKVAKVEPGFASVDITSKTAEIRKGYLAEISSTGATETVKPPLTVKEIDIAGEWTMTASKDAAFGSEFTGGKPFRLEKTATPGVFRNPGSSNARVVVVKDELHFYNNAGGRGATTKIQVDPKTGALARIEWSDGSVFTRKSLVNPTSTVGNELDYLPDDCFNVGSFDVAAFMKSKVYQELKGQIKEFVGGFGLIEQRIRIAPENLARFTTAGYVVRIGDNYETTKDIVIATTINAINAADIKAKMKPYSPSAKDYRLAEITVGKYTVYEENYQFETDDKSGNVIKGQAFCVVEDRIVLFGQLDGIKKVLDRDRKPALSRGMAAELKSGLSDGYTVIFELRGFPEYLRKSMAKELGQAIPGFSELLDGCRMLTVRGNASENVVIRGTLICKDKSSAESVQKVAYDGLSLLKVYLGTNSPRDSVEIKEVKRTVTDAVGPLKLSTQDAEVKAELTIEASKTANVLRALFELKKAQEKQYEDMLVDLTGEWTMVASKNTAFGTEFTGAKTFRLEKTATPGIFRNPGSSNARITVVKDELIFINNAVSFGASAKFQVNPKTSVLERVVWSDGSTWTRVMAGATEPKKVEKSSELSGRWSQKLVKADPPDEKPYATNITWQLRLRPDGRYDAEMEGSTDTRGIGVLSGDEFKIEWKNPDYQGIETWKLTQDRKTGTGAQSFRSNFSKFTLVSGFHVERLDSPPPEPKKVGGSDKSPPPVVAPGLSGRWEDRENSLVVILQRRADGLYDVSHYGIKQYGNDPQGKGVAQLSGKTLKIDFDTGGRFRSNKGFGIWEVNGSGTLAKGVVTIFTGDKEKESTHSSLLVRLDAVPPPQPPVEPNREEGFQKLDRALRYAKAMEQGAKYMQEKNYGSAAKEFREALSQFPESEKARDALLNAQKAGELTDPKEEPKKIPVLEFKQFPAGWADILRPSDPPYARSKDNQRHKSLLLNMEKGKTYHITMKATDKDGYRPSLWIEDPAGKILVANYADVGSRITAVTISPYQTGMHRIIAASRDGWGSFTLEIRDYSPRPAEKSDK